jgi:hypothetical protein
MDNMFEKLVETHKPKTVLGLEDLLSPWQDVGSEDLKVAIREACTSLKMSKSETRAQLFIIRMNIEAICEIYIFKFLADDMLHSV